MAMICDDRLMAKASSGLHKGYMGPHRLTWGYTCTGLHKDTQNYIMLPRVT